MEQSKLGIGEKLLPMMRELSDHSKAKEGGTAVKPTLSVRHSLTPEGQVSWQWDYVTSCGPQRTV